MRSSERHPRCRRPIEVAFREICVWLIVQLLDARGNPLMGGREIRSKGVVGWGEVLHSRLVLVCSLEDLTRGVRPAFGEAPRYDDEIVLRAKF